MESTTDESREVNTDTDTTRAEGEYRNKNKEAETAQRVSGQSGDSSRTGMRNSTDRDHKGRAESSSGQADEGIILVDIPEGGPEPHSLMVIEEEPELPSENNEREATPVPKADRVSAQPSVGSQALPPATDGNNVSTVPVPPEESFKTVEVFKTDIGKPRPKVLVDASFQTGFTFEENLETSKDPGQQMKEYPVYFQGSTHQTTNKSMNESTVGGEKRKKGNKKTAKEISSEDPAQIALRKQDKMLAVVQKSQNKGESRVVGKSDSKKTSPLKVKQNSNVFTAKEKELLEQNHKILSAMLNKPSKVYLGESAPRDPYLIPKRLPYLQEELDAIEREMYKLTGDSFIGNGPAMLQTRSIRKVRNYFENYEDMRLINDNFRVFNLFHNTSMLIAAPHCYVLFAVVQRPGLQAADRRQFDFYNTLVQQNMDMRRFLKLSNDPGLCNIVWSAGKALPLPGFEASSIRDIQPAHDIVPMHELRYLKSILTPSKLEDLVSQFKKLRLFKTTFWRQGPEEIFRQVIERFSVVNVACEQVSITNHIEGMQVLENLPNLYRVLAKEDLFETDEQKAAALQSLRAKLQGRRVCVPKTYYVPLQHSNKSLNLLVPLLQGPVIIRKNESVSESWVCENGESMANLLKTKYGLAYTKPEPDPVEVPVAAAEPEKKKTLGKDKPKPTDQAPPLATQDLPPAAQSLEQKPTAEPPRPHLEPARDPRSAKAQETQTEPISRLPLPLDCDHLCVQEYVKAPLLIKGKKFDMKFYVLIVKMFDNLTGYLYSEGQARVASENFSLANLKNSYCHFTNFEVQKNRTARLTQTPSSAHYFRTTLYLSASWTTSSPRATSFSRGNSRSRST